MVGDMEIEGGVHVVAAAPAGVGVDPVAIGELVRHQRVAIDLVRVRVGPAGGVAVDRRAEHNFVEAQIQVAVARRAAPLHEAEAAGVTEIGFGINTALR